MDTELLHKLGSLSPSNQRLVRELIQRLIQLEQLTTKPVPEDHLDLHQEVNHWVSTLVNRGLSPGTIRNYRTWISELINGFPRPTKADIDTFLTRMVSRGISPGATNNIISALRSFFSYLRDMELINQDPTSRIRRPRVTRRVRQAPSPEVVSKLVAPHLDTRYYCLLRLLVDCGLRVHEVVKIRLSDIDMEKLLITVTGKGGKTRVVPFSNSTYGAIRAQLVDLNEHGYQGEWLFPGKDARKHLTTNAVRRELRRLCKRMGLPHITPHQLRHYFATSMLSAGASLRVTAEILGHSQPSTTANIYWHVIDQGEIVQEYRRFYPQVPCGKNVENSSIQPASARGVFHNPVFYESSGYT